MELKDGMTVIAPCDTLLFRKGEEFLVTNVNKIKKPYLYSFNINFKAKTKGSLCLLNKCSYLDYQDWIIKPNKK